MTWYRIEAPHLCAGIKLGPSGRIVDGAPILRWMIGRRFAEIESYCARRRWRLDKLERRAGEATPAAPPR